MTLGYEVIPQIIGPPLFIKPGCFLDTESGGMFELEDGRGFIQLETCDQVPIETLCFLDAEFGGLFQLEDGAGYIALETCNQPPSTLIYLIGDEAGLNALATEDGLALQDEISG